MINTFGLFDSHNLSFASRENLINSAIGIRGMSVVWISEDTSKKLWLRVARHVVQEKNDIKQVKLISRRDRRVKLVTGFVAGSGYRIIRII